jgi:anti-sigma B factor antagonist
MKIEGFGDVVRISDVQQLGATNANAFRHWVRKSLSDAHKNIEIDLSEATFLDSCGLGALVALHKTVRGRGGSLRLLNPQPSVQQLLDLTRLNLVFEVVNA